MSLEGRGLHTGKPAKITFLPAKENTGINFFLKDETIPASAEFVSSTQRGVCLTKNKKTIKVVEHVLAALSGLRISNINIELSEEELPSTDGSALPFVKKLLEAGIKKQTLEQKIVEVSSIIIVENGNKKIKVLPAKNFQVSFFIEFPIIGIQTYKYNESKNNFIKEIAPARTFGYENEVEELKKRGLALGANLENALAIGEKGYINQPRFENEPVRHKILDLIGDLMLSGYHIKGHFMAERSGHKLNIELAKKLKERIQ